MSQDPIEFAGNNPTFYGYVYDTNSGLDLFGLNIVTVYHYTSKKSYNKISSQSPYVFKASIPKKGNPKGVYVTTKSPEILAKNNNGYKKLGLTGNKSSHFFEIQIDDSKLKSLNGDRGQFIKYIDGDVEIDRSSVTRHGETPKIH